MKQEIFLKTYELIDEIKEISEYKRLIELKAIIQNDEETSSLVLAFKKLNDQYLEVSKYGKHHPDLKKVKQLFSLKKEELYNHPLIREYKQCEKKIETVLTEVATELAISVSKKIKHPNEIGLIEKSR
jgi:cell fate (sporulation/competence/biofilm development) regulator YlbF (YheA/YmcA/DUF963 family)